MQLPQLRLEVLELLVKHVHDLDGIDIDDVKKAMTETVDWFYGTEE